MYARGRHRRNFNQENEIIHLSFKKDHPGCKEQKDLRKPQTKKEN